MAARTKVETGLRESEKVAPRMDHYNAVFRGYVNVNLTESQRDALPAWLVGTSVDGLLKAWCSSGCVVSMKLDPKTGNFMASVTQRDEGSVNAGLAVTARANHPVKALERLLYILSILGEGSWEAVQPMADPDRW